MATITLRGEELRCVDGGVSLDVLFDLGEAFQDQASVNLLQAAALLKRVLYEQVVPEEHARLKDALRHMTVKDIDELNQAVGGLLAAETGRPTERPSESPSGSVPTGGPTRVVSFSRGMAREAAQSSKAGRSAAS